MEQLYLDDPQLETSLRQSPFEDWYSEDHIEAWGYLCLFIGIILALEQNLRKQVVLDRERLQGEFLHYLLRYIIFVIPTCIFDVVI
jgi:hypothetical protein